jgi:hypothetical protein
VLLFAGLAVSVMKLMRLARVRLAVAEGEALHAADRPG